MSPTWYGYEFLCDRCGHGALRHAQRIGSDLSPCLDCQCEDFEYEAAEENRPHRASLHALNEAQFTDQIIDLMKLSGWLVSHNRGDMRHRIQGMAGVPDIIAVHVKDGLARLLFAELKMPKGRFTPEQTRWLMALRKTDAEVYVWTPDQMPAIIATLTSK